MLLYHGSNVEVKEPKLLDSKRQLDFGNGFYLTSDIEQARRWALRKVEINHSGKPLISIFEIDETKLNSLKVLTFDKANRSWLRYIVAHRSNKAINNDNYDVVIGPVANDQAVRTVNNFMLGYIPIDIAIRLLKPQNLKDQYVFRTNAALNLLQYKETKVL